MDILLYSYTPMLTLSIDVDETVENYLRSKDIDTISYLWKLIQEDMLLDENKWKSSIHTISWS